MFCQKGRKKIKSVEFSTLTGGRVKTCHISTLLLIFHLPNALKCLNMHIIEKNASFKTIQCIRIFNKRTNN